MRTLCITCVGINALIRSSVCASGRSAKWVRRSRLRHLDQFSQAMLLMTQQMTWTCTMPCSSGQRFVKTRYTTCLRFFCVLSRRGNIFVFPTITWKLTLREGNLPFFQHAILSTRFVEPGNSNMCAYPTAFCSSASAKICPVLTIPVLLFAEVSLVNLVQISHPLFLKATFVASHCKKMHGFATNDQSSWLN